MHVARAVPLTFLMTLLLLAMAGTAVAQTTAPAPAPQAAPADSALTDPPADPQLFSEEWIQNTKQPVDWFKWGADLRLRDEYRRNAITLDESAPANEYNYGRYRTRAWSTITPVKDLDFNSRIAWEFRNFCRPKGEHTGPLEDIRSTNWDEAIIDNLNVKWSNALGAPATLTVGRQDIKLDDGWLVFEGTPLDGSRTVFYDAARLNYNFEQAKTVLDLIYIEQSANSDQWIEPFNDQERLLVEQDQRAAVFHVANKSIENTELDGYFIFQKNMAENFPSGVESNIYAYGGRVVHQFDEHWRARAEMAQELGHKNFEDLCALGFNSRLSYFVNDEWNNNFRLSYEFLSGDDPDTETNEEFDPLWGRWPQWSELMVYAYAGETRVGYITNLHRVGPGWSFNPTKKFEVCADYYLLFADENTFAGRSGFSSGGDFRGQLLALLLQYTFNPHVKTHFVSEFLFPGNYYDEPRGDTAMFMRYELMFTW